VRPWVVRAITSSLLAIWTGAWLVCVYAYTWVACFGTSPLCHDGVVAQLILTAIYAVGLALGAWVNRRLRRQVRR